MCEKVRSKKITGEINYSETSLHWVQNTPEQGGKITFGPIAFKPGVYLARVTPYRETKKAVNREKHYECITNNRVLGFSMVQILCSTRLFLKANIAEVKDVKLEINSG